jgi:hypothetical protein
MSLGLAQHSLLCFLIILPFGNPTVEGQLGNMALWLLARLNLGRITHPWAVFGRTVNRRQIAQQLVNKPPIRLYLVQA